IEGRFDGDPTPYFYRIDFKGAGNNLIPVLRNHWYRINITATTPGGGSTNKGDAFGSPSLTLTSSHFGSNGIGPAKSGHSFNATPSMRRNGIRADETSGISYTVTVMNENENQ